ncbi:hypothetical protein ACFQZJ_11375 [Maribacter chungangensis]|uniref:Uncharacterized protein n=1 Tax=Maribacter chungangensis TaxID=1069117 RepID=A0ABW3B416_9FLAO
MRVFNETQRFNQWWLWLILGASALVVINKPIINWIQSDFKDTSAFDTGFLIGCGTVLFVLYLFILFKLTTSIDERGISYQFFPMQLQPKLLLWKEIEKVWTRQYRPLMENGGWGYKWGTSGKVMTVKGNKGIQIKMKNGKSLLLGTQKMKEAQAVLNKYHTTNEGI